MGKTSGKHKAGKHDHKRKHRSHSPHRLYRKALKYIARGSAGKLDKLLREHPDAARSQGLGGNTALHDACRAGSAAALHALLAGGALLEAPDASGNTPLHVAAMHGHVHLVNSVLQLGRSVDVDVPNKHGQTVFNLVEAAMARQQQQQQQQQRAHSGSTSGSSGGSPGKAPAWSGRGAAAGACFGAEEVVGAAAADDFQERLRYEMWAEDMEAAEMSYGERWGGSAAGAAAGVEDEDAWADRIWAEMQARRRQQQQEAARAFLGDLRKEQRQREERARQESERILREERAKDAAWRQAAQRQAPSAAALRAAYDAGWQALQALLPGGSIGYGDVPWLVPDLADSEQFEAVVLHGVEGPADVKKRLRSELLRWHPDKFTARFGGVLVAEDRQRVLEGVQQTSQMLTSMVSR